MPPVAYLATHRPRFAVGVIDALAQALTIQGPLAAPVGDLRCQVVQQLTPVARGFTPPLLLQTTQTANGFLILEGTYRTQGNAEAVLPLGNGQYLVEISGSYYQSAQFLLEWPPPAIRTPIDPLTGQPVDVPVLPGAAYPFPDLTASRFNLGPTLIRGTVLTSSGDPVPGAQVSLINLPAITPPNPPWPFTSSTTSQSGDWALLLPDRRRLGFLNETMAPPPLQLIVRILYPDGTVVDTPHIPVTLGRENAVANTALRGRVVGPGGRPIAGALIETSLSPEQSETRPDGQWFLYLDPNQPDASNVTVTATAPDGTAATATGVEVKQRATVVVPTIHIV
jgi:hypothetical protein